MRTQRLLHPKRIFMRIHITWNACLVFCFTSLLVGCNNITPTGVLAANGSPSFVLMDFSNPPTINPITPGWYHRHFSNRAPMDISFVSKQNLPAIRLSTDNSASMLYRWVDVEIEKYPALSWNWFIEQTISTKVSEMTVAGDDHPARLYLRFESASGDEHAMEIIWGNRLLKRGDWKHLSLFMDLFPFPHYTANGGDENAGRWHHERVNLPELYATLWGDPRGARLVALALFCDTDDTGAKSIAYFSNIRVEAEG